MAGDPAHYKGLLLADTRGLFWRQPLDLLLPRAIMNALPGQTDPTYRSAGTGYNGTSQTRSVPGESTPVRPSGKTWNEEHEVPYGANLNGGPPPRMRVRPDWTRRHRVEHPDMIGF
jgi:hypothetical protein